MIATDKTYSADKASFQAQLASQNPFQTFSVHASTTVMENYADNTSAYVTGRVLNGYTDGHVVSAPVGSFQASRKGLYDLGGNVAEWVHDVYTIPSANGTSELDPLGSQSGDNYVIRGASWSLSKLAELRLSFREYGQAGRDDVGFRIARYAE